MPKSPITEFTTHLGEKVTGQKLAEALGAVADDWAALGRAIRDADDYASHVTEAQKDENLRRDLERAKEIRKGFVESFTIAQRLNEKLTGECVALLGKD